MRRLLPPRLFLIGLVLSLVGGLVVPLAGPLPVAVRLLGIPLFLAGLWLNLAGALRFSRLGTNIVTVDDPDLLVTDGPFAWSRNPMYLGFLAMGAAAALGVGTAGAWLGPALFFVAADRWYIPFEEGRLAAVFGDTYLRYRSVVRRWLGRRGPVGRESAVGRGSAA